MNNIFRLIVFTLPPILVGAAVIAYFAISKPPPEQAPFEERSTHVRVITIVPSEVVPSVIGYGVVRPARTWNGISQVGGKVVYVHPDFQKGASMAAGTQIVRLSPSDYNLAIAQAEANIRSSQARLQELEVNEENTRQSLKIEQEALTLKNNELERKQALLDRGSATQAAVETAQSSALAQRQKVQGMKNTLTLIPTQRAVLEEQIAVYQSNLQTAELNLARTSIELPFAARVAETNTEISQYVVPGQSIGSFDGVEKAEIDTQIPIQQFAQMLGASGDKNIMTQIAPGAFSKVLEKFGLAATVRLDLGDKPVVWQGAVSRISDTIDPKTRTVGIIVTVSNAYERLQPGKRPPLAKGMFVEVTISNKARKNALVVPRSALHKGKIYVADKSNRLEARKVDVDFVQNDIAIISNNLSSGDRVVVSALNPAVPGMLLKTTRDTVLEQWIQSQSAEDGKAK